MGFEMKKVEYGFAPVVTCDICGDAPNADMLCFDHDWDCKKFRVVCKGCNNKYGLRAEAWMEMEDYITRLVHNLKVDMKSRNKIIDIVNRNA